ncbi:MAG: DUF4167 domain-containing protein [Pseudomonadota bacterium]
MGRRVRHRGSSNSSSHTHSHSNQRRPNQNNKNRVFDSNGPDVRIRGTAYQITEKYAALAKDAAASGDRVLSESYLQHAEHYQRIINVIAESEAAYYDSVAASADESEDTAEQSGEGEGEDFVFTRANATVSAPAPEQALEQA